MTDIIVEDKKNRASCFFSDCIDSFYCLFQGQKELCFVSEEENLEERENADSSNPMNST